MNLTAPFAYTGIDRPDYVKGAFYMKIVVIQSPKYLKGILKSIFGLR